MTARELLSSIRTHFLADVYGVDNDSHRWSDDFLLKAINDAMNAIITRRPTAALSYDDEGTLRRITDASVEIDEEIPLDLVRWKTAISNHVAARCFTDESQDTSNQALAQRYTTAFEKEVQ